MADAVNTDYFNRLTAEKSLLIRGGKESFNTMGSVSN
jgi:hypothetical protein